MVKYSQGDHKPLYDLIIGHKTFHNLNCVLDFAEQAIMLDGITLPMRKIESVQDPKVVFSIYCETLETIITLEETNRTVQILDANYSKANLRNFLKNLLNYQKMKELSY